MKRINPVVAIDGPVGSGKSTTARLAAKKLGFLYIDTGAMYRALTLKVLREGIDTRSEQEVAKLLQRTHIDIEWIHDRLRIFLDDEDVTDEIRSGEVTDAVSAVSEHKAVRNELVAMQRKMGEHGGVVMEGRDIASVVFPDAEVKIYLDADIEERVRRRYKERCDRGENVSYSKLLEDIKERDRLNMERDIAPLIKVPEAIILDTSGLSIEEQVDRVVHLVQDRITCSNRKE